jgi:hypothetical protein
MSEMSPTDTREWAKEELLDALDSFIATWKENERPHSYAIEELNALYLQRNRVARLFKLSVKEVDYTQGS